MTARVPPTIEGGNTLPPQRGLEPEEEPQPQPRPTPTWGSVPSWAHPPAPRPPRVDTSGRPIAGSPLVQELAASYAAWQLDLNGTSDLLSIQNYDWTAATAFGRLAATQWIPEHQELLRRNFTLYVAQIEANEAFRTQKIRLSLSPLDKLLALTDDQLAEVESRLLKAELVVAQQNEWATLTSDLNRGYGEQVSRDEVLARLDPRPRSDILLGQEGIVYQELTRGTTGLNEMIRIAEGGGDLRIAGNFLNRLTGRPFRWVASDGRLAVEVTGADGQSYVFDVSLDSPIGDSPLDAMVALTEAVYGTRHRLTESEVVPGQQTNVGKFYEFVGTHTEGIQRYASSSDHIINWILDPPSQVLGHLTPFVGDPNQPWFAPRWRSSDQIVVERNKRLMDSLPPQEWDARNQLLFAIKAAQAEELPREQAVQFGFAWWDSQDPESRELVAGELSQASAKAAEAQIKSLYDTRTPFQRVRDDVTQKIVGTADAWIRFAYMNIISLDAFLQEDIPEAVVNLFEGEGWEGFKAAFDWEEGSAAFRGELTPADFVGLDEDDSLRGFVNLLGSLAGDPFTWVGASGVMRSRSFAAMMTSEEGVDRFLRLASGYGSVSPSLRNLGSTLGITAGPTGKEPWLILLQEAQATGNTKLLAGMLIHTGVSPRGWRDILNGVPIEAVLRRDMTEGLMLPSLSGGLKLRNQATTIAQLAKADDGSLTRVIQRMFSQFSTRRQMSLAPDQALDDAVAHLMARSVWDETLDFDAAFREVLAATDVDSQATRDLVKVWTERVARDRVRLVQEGQVIGFRDTVAANARATQALDRIDDLTAAARATTDVDEIARLESLIDAVRNGERDLALARAAGDSTDDLLARIQEAGGLTLPDDFDPVSGLGSRLDEAVEWQGRFRDQTRELERLRALRNRSLEPSGQREVLMEWWERQWEDMRNLLDIDDWKEVAGPRGTMTTDDLATAMAMGDKNLADELKLIGVTDPPGIFMAPVSPMQLVAYASRRDSKWWQTVIADPYRHGVGRALDQVRKGWTADVLFNMFTVVRSNLDEPLRDWWQNGLRAAAPRAGRRFEAILHPVELPAGANAYTRRMTRPWHTPDLGPQFISPTATARTWSEGNLPLAVDSVSKAEFNNAAKQWMNGTLPSRPIIRYWAQARYYDDPGIFRDFWDNLGGRHRAGPVVRVGQRTNADMLPADAASGLDRTLDALAYQVAPSNREAWKQAVIKAWATGEDVPEAIWRQLKAVPTVQATAKPIKLGPIRLPSINSAYEALFGRPAATHSGFLVNDYTERAYHILEARLGEKLLTPERIMQLLPGTTEARARSMLSAGVNPWVDDMVKTQGYFTPRMVRNQASRTARVHADHMAYQMGASTFAGQRLQQVFPFLKAQLDFLGYWYRELVSGTELGLNPILAKPLKRLGIASETTPFVGRTVQLPRYVMPLNLRLAGRMLDFAGTLTSFPEDDPEQDLLSRWIRNYTFLPGDLEDDFWIQLTPGLGPIPSWVLHMLPTSEEQAEDFPLGLGEYALAARRFLDAAFPSFQYYDQQADPFDFFDFVFPDSKVSLRRIVERGADYLNAVGPQWGISADDPLGSDWAAPPGFHAHLRRLIAAELVDNPTIVRGSPEWNDMMRRVNRQAWEDAARGNIVSTFSDIASISGYELDTDDGGYLDLYEGFVSELDNLWRAGVVGDAQRDGIEELWGRRDSLTYDESSRLGDELSDVLFGLPDGTIDLMLVRHPELAVNLTSQWRCTLDAPDEYCYQGRLVTPPGEKGREIREQARRENWIVRRDPEEMWNDAYARLARSRRDLRNQIWTKATGYAGWSTPADSRRDDRTRITGFEATALRALGFEVPEDPWTTTFGELFDLLSSSQVSMPSHLSDFSTSVTDAKLVDYGVPQRITQVRRAMNDSGYDGDDPATWPEETRQYVRDIYTRAINTAGPDGTQLITETDYKRELARVYGELDYAAPVPPPLRESDAWFTVDRGDLEVVDGDTVQVTFDDGSTRLIRFIGVNAAEENSSDPVAYRAYLEQTESLRELLDGASEIGFGVHDTERFLATQVVADGGVRFLMWLYIDGQPVFDPAAFTSRQPTGYRLGGEGI